MTSATAIAEKVRTALAREIKRDPHTITADQALREDLGLNSLDAIELMFKVEEEFDLEIPDADLQKLRTVGDLVSYLEGRLGVTPPVPRPASPPVAVQPPPAPAPPKSPTSRPPAAGKRSAKRSRA